MIQSMTGYGKSVVTYNGKKINVEVKSLNSKTIDLSTRIAQLYREKEIEVRKKINLTLERGKIDLAIWIEKTDGTDGTSVNAALIESYYAQLKAVVEQTGMPEPRDWLATLVHMPDITTRTDVETLEEGEWEMVSKAIDEALEHLIEFRKQEGEALRKKLEEKLTNINDLLASIEPYEKSRVEKIKARIIDGLKTIPEIEYNNNRLEQELIYYIEKLDISEEKQRLANHLRYFHETMDNGQGQGKKLGFISQEMGREINTTGSKSNQAEMQNIVVRMKDELEQIKEQVLNVL